MARGRTRRTAPACTAACTAARQRRDRVLQLACSTAVQYFGGAAVRDSLGVQVSCSGIGP